MCYLRFCNCLMKFDFRRDPIKCSLIQQDKREQDSITLNILTGLIAKTWGYISILSRNRNSQKRCVFRIVQKTKQKKRSFLLKKHPIHWNHRKKPRYLHRYLKTKFFGAKFIKEENNQEKGCSKCSCEVSKQAYFCYTLQIQQVSCTCPNKSIISCAFSPGIHKQAV